MTPFLQIARAAAAGAATEFGREAAQSRRGLGFLNVSNDGAGGGDDYYWYNPFEDGDSFGDYGFDFFAGGGGWPSFDPFTLPDLQAPNVSASGNESRYDFDWGQFLSDWLSGDLFSINTTEQGTPSYRDITGNLDYRDSSWDWLNAIGPGPASLDPQYGPAGDGSMLPGYCPKGTYHPVNNPTACVPFPADDPNAKRQAQQQRKAQQQAAQAARKAQQQRDKTCPRDPQGRPVWKNPATGKCELVPQCPQGSKFDSTTKRCLNANELKQVYGDTNWLLWILLGGSALLLLSNRDSGGRKR